MTVSDIVTSIYRRTKTNSSSFTAADMLLSINAAYQRVATLILVANGWQFDDSNKTDLPSATTALESGQQDYTLATDHLTIDRVEVKDTSGNWTALTQIDQQLLKGDRQVALAAYQSTTGVPKEYDVSGNSVFLYPAPNYSQSASLKVYFTRSPALYTSGEVSTGTKEPGFASLFHDLIPLWVSYDYAIENGLNTANGFLAAIQLKEKELYDFYGNRNRDQRRRMTTSTDNNR